MSWTLRFLPFIRLVSYYKGSCNLRIPSCQCFCLENIIIICISSGRLRWTKRLHFSPLANLHLFIWLIRSCHFKYVFNLFWSIKFDICHPREPSYDGISLIIPTCRSMPTYLSNSLSVCIVNCSKMSSVTLFFRQFWGKKAATRFTPTVICGLHLGHDLRVAVRSAPRKPPHPLSLCCPHHPLAHTHSLKKHQQPGGGCGRVTRHPLSCVWEMPFPPSILEERIVLSFRIHPVVSLDSQIEPTGIRYGNSIIRSIACLIVFLLSCFMKTG